MSNAIETRGLSYRASPSFALRDVDLRVPEGSIYGFLGPNGAGKTTTIRVLLAMLRPDAGDIEVLGQPMPASAPRVLARTGFVPERPHIYPSLTVDETLRYHAAFWESWSRDRARDLAGGFGLDPAQRVSRLSKGETGQLLMLLALAQGPELLVLDEPTEGLDPLVRRDILAAVLDYVSQRNASVFISSHLVHELEGVCDWIGVMDRGRMIAEMRIGEFKDGVKRLRIENPPAVPDDPPFVLLARRQDGTSAGESWAVRGWRPEMAEYFQGSRGTLKEVLDLDLEESFVELLGTSRLSAGERGD